MKTPEEIKKALKLCQNGSCKFCPYDDDGFCGHSKNEDALAYIQQLEDAVDKTIQLMRSATEVITKSQEQLESTYSQVKKALCGKENVSWVEVLDAVDQLKSRLAQVERERNAMSYDMHQLQGALCAYCKNLYRPKDALQVTCSVFGDGYGDSADSPLLCGSFKWRGPCPENTKEE